MMTATRHTTCHALARTEQRHKDLVLRLSDSGDSRTTALRAAIENEARRIRVLRNLMARAAA